MEREKLSATNIRKRITTDQNWEELVPNGTKKVLEKINAKKRLMAL